MSNSVAHVAGLSNAFGKTLTTTIGITAGSFVSSVITARILGPEGRGLMSATLLIATLAATLAQAGMASSYVYHHGASRTLPYLRILFASLLGISLIACGFAWGGLQINLAIQLHQQTALVLLLAIFMATQMYFSSLTQLQADLHFFNVLRAGIVFGNLFMLIPVLLFFKHIGFQHIILSQVLVLIVLTACACGWANNHKIWRLTTVSRRGEIAEVLKYGLGQHGTTVLSILLMNFDKLVLLTRGNVIEYGFYALAFSTSRLIGAVQDAVSVAIFSRFAGRDTEKLGESVAMAFRLSFVPMLAVAAAGAASAQWSLRLVYGHAFSAVAIPFAILLFECVVSGGSWTLAQRFNASGRPGLVFMRQIVSIFPVFIAIPFLPHKHAFIYLALLMLGAACVRLSMTLVLYVFTLKEPLPRFLPTSSDLRIAKKIFLKGRSRFG